MTDPAANPPPEESYEKPESLWMRGLWMLILAALVSLAQTLLLAATIVQFLIMLFDHRKPNSRIAEFGDRLGAWLQKAARFQTVASEEKPFPWSNW